MKVKKNYGEMYLLPSLFSLTNLFFGFLSIQMSLHGRYRWAAFWIIVAAIMDGFDGIVARATKSQSDFGIELDSLADAVSFGAATSTLIFLWGLHRTGAPGMFFSFVFLAAGVLRLARYNVRTKALPDRKYYQGLTVPSAAMFMSAIVNFHPAPLATREAGFLVAVAMLVVSLCMVSSLPYPNFVKAFIGQRVNIRTGLFVAVSLFGVLFYARYFLLLYFGLNVLSGPTVALVRALKKRPRKKTEPKVIPS